MAKYDLGQLRGAFGAGFNKGQLEAPEEESGRPNMTGKYFIDFDENGEMHWAGYIQKRIEPGVYRCLLVSAIYPKGPTTPAAVNYQEMARWTFYATESAWVYAYDEWWNKARKQAGL